MGAVGETALLLGNTAHYSIDCCARNSNEPSNATLTVAPHATPALTRTLALADISMIVVPLLISHPRYARWARWLNPFIPKLTEVRELRVT